LLKQNSEDVHGPSTGVVSRGERPNVSSYSCGTRLAIIDFLQFSGEVVLSMSGYVNMKIIF